MVGELNLMSRMSSHGPLVCRSLDVMGHGLIVWCMMCLMCADCQARKRHININFFVRLVLGRPRVCPGDSTGFVPWDKPGEILGQTRAFSLFYTVPWDKPGLSLGQSRGRRAAQKVHVKKVYVPFSLARLTHYFTDGPELEAQSWVNVGWVS